MDENTDNFELRMERIRIELSDGRYLIYYTFGDEPEEPPAE